jgi:hypothetical protein
VTFVQRSGKRKATQNLEYENEENAQRRQPSRKAKQQKKFP